MKQVKRFLIPLASILALALSAAPGAKRPLNHSDYDGWRHIQDQHLSDDGTWLAYALFPQEGDGQVIVRNLRTGKEIRENAGELPPPPPANYATTTEDAPPPQRRIEMHFTDDSKTLVVSTFAPHAEVEKDKREKKKPAERSKGGMVIFDLAGGKQARIEHVKSFQLPKAGGFVAYLREGSGGEKYGTELVVRNLASGAERTFADVTEFAAAKDAKTLVYAVSAKGDEANGVYVAAPGSAETPKALVSGKGKYSKLTWDENQDELAFFSAGKLNVWRRGTEGQPAAVASSADGFPAGMIISDRGNITFSKDGRKVFFGYAPKPVAAKKDDTPAEDRVSVDLWHWRDDYIQPMQKVRAQVDRTRSYRLVYDVTASKLVTLGDPSLAEIAPGEDGRYSIGGDDRAYRRMNEYDERYSDAYIVDNVTGARRLVAKQHRGRVTWSPDGRHAVFFDGKDWIGISAADGKVSNLTGSLAVKFWTEEHDSPGSAPAYGMAGWMKDGKSVVLYDHYDLWQIPAEGGEARNLTEGLGRREHRMLRYVKLDEDPNERGIDPAKPLILRADDNETHDTGFYRLNLNGTARLTQLVMGPKNYGAPVKAKNAEVYALPVSSFTECPDLHVTDASFKELRKVSDANPQQSGINWGTAELVHFKNVDGVPLKGTLYKPENFDPKKKYPLLVYIYERLSQGVHTYVEPRPGHTINVSYYVSNGYLVLEPDIVYSIGYPGKSALDCVLPAVQAVVDQGFVDEKAIGIQGHSWGGYQIAYMITQTTRFRAVAAGAPVANMTSAYDGIRWGPGIPRQFQYERTQSRIGGNLWEYPMRYIENSPIFMADRVKTPVMMIHNDADDAVPWYQGIEFYLALRRLGKEAYLFTYNGEPHGLRRRPNQKDYALRLQQYFDFYLKGAPKPDWMERGIPYLEKPGVTVGETDQ